MVNSESDWSSVMTKHDYFEYNINMIYRQLFLESGVPAHQITN